MRLVKFLVLFVMAVFLFIIALPTILSLPATRGPVIALASSGWRGSVEVEHIQLGWMSSQEIRGLRVQDEQGRNVFTLERFRSDASLFRLLSRGGDLGETALEKPQLTLYATAPKELPTEPKPPSSGRQSRGRSPRGGAFFLPVTGRFTINDGRILIEQTDARPISIEQLNAELFKAGWAEPLSFQLGARSRQGSLQGSVRIEGDVKGFDGSGRLLTERDAAGQLRLAPEASIDLNVALDKVPVLALERLLSIPRLQSALGDQLELYFENSIQGNTWTLQGRADAPQLQLRLAGQSTAQGFELARPAQLTWTVSPSFFRDFTNERATLQEPLRIDAGIERLRIPFAELAFDYKHLAGSAQISVGNATLAVPDMENYRLEAMQVELESLDLGSEITLSLVGRGSLPNRDSRVELRAVVAQLVDAEQRFNRNASVLADLVMRAAPITLLDRIAGYDGSLEGSLGSFADGMLRVNGNLDTLSATGSMSSEALDLQSLNVDIDRSQQPPRFALAVTGESILQPKQVPGPLTISAHSDGQDLSARIQSAILDLEILGTLSKDGSTFTWTRPLLGRYRLTPELLHGEDLDATKRPLLTSVTDINFDIAPQTLTIKPFDLGQLFLAGNARVDELTVAGGPAQLSASVDETGLAWGVDMKNARAELVATGQARTGRGDAGRLDARFVATNWWDGSQFTRDAARVDAGIDLERFPAAILAALSGFDQLEIYLGETVELKLESELSSVSPLQGNFDLNLRGVGFETNLQLDADSESIRLRQRRPSRILWVINNERFQALYGEGLELADSANINIELRQLNIPRDGRSFQLQLEADASGLQLRDLFSQEQLRLEQLKLLAKTDAFAEKTDFQLTGRGRSSQSGQLDVNVSGDVRDLQDAEGSWNWDQPSAQLRASLFNLPARMLASLSGLGTGYAGYFEAAFGGILNAEIYTDLVRGSEALTAELSSTNSAIQMQGLVEDGVLTLSRNLEGKLLVTPALSREVLRNINPMLVTAIDGEEPIGLSIRPEEFSIPLFPVDMSRANIGAGQLRLGKLRVRSGGPLGIFIGVFDSFGLRPVDVMDAWFTPQYFSMRDGVLRLERMDFLIDNQFHLCTWGAVDIPGERVDMIAGITEPTLNRNFFVSGLPEDYVMQHRMTGPLGEASPDMARFTAQLLALQTGDLGRILSPLLGGGGRPPAPTTQPLPWERFERRSPPQQQPQRPQQRSPQQRSPLDSLPGLLENFLTPPE